jgi:hypothetical protein
VKAEVRREWRRSFKDGGKGKEEEWKVEVSYKVGRRNGKPRYRQALR